MLFTMLGTTRASSFEVCDVSSSCSCMYVRMYNTAWCNKWLLYHVHFGLLKTETPEEYHMQVTSYNHRTDSPHVLNVRSSVWVSFMMLNVLIETNSIQLKSGSLQSQPLLIWVHFSTPFFYWNTTFLWSESGCLFDGICLVGRKDFCQLLLHTSVVTTFPGLACHLGENWVGVLRFTI